MITAICEEAAWKHATLQNFLIRVTLRDALICTLLRARTESGADHEHR
jgi:hypothetical protein